jgi:hypothetical protein
MSALLATYHLAAILEACRQLGLREHAARVRILREARGQDGIFEMKPRRVEIRIDCKKVDHAIADLMNASDPFAALDPPADGFVPIGALQQRIRELEGR